MNQLEKPAVDAQGALASINESLNIQNDRLYLCVDELLKIIQNVGVFNEESFKNVPVGQTPLELADKQNAGGVLSQINDKVNQYENLLDKLRHLIADLHKL